MLQWGRVVIDAERGRRRRQPDAPRGASMGPRRDRRGETAPTAAHDAAATASMGPRRDRRGEMTLEVGIKKGHALQWGRVVIDAERCVCGLHRCPATAASMGPRRDRRGEFRSDAMTDTQQMLQWGRVVIDAERCWPITSTPRERSLQWGRVVIDAERPTSSAQAWPRRCFNGAAS